MKSSTTTLDPETRNKTKKKKETDAKNILTTTEGGNQVPDMDVGDGKPDRPNSA